MSWKINTIPVPLGNRDRYNLVDDKGRIITELSDFTEDQRTLIENAPKVKQNISRYLKIVEWARLRYTRSGVLIVSVGNHPSPYTRIEKMAAQKYLY